MNDRAIKLAKGEGLVITASDSDYFVELVSIMVEESLERYKRYVETNTPLLMDLAILSFIMVAKNKGKKQFRMTKDVIDLHFSDFKMHRTDNQDMWLSVEDNGEILAPMMDWS